MAQSHGDQHHHRDQESSEEEVDDDESDSSCGLCHDPDDPDGGEKRHFLDVCWSLVQYGQDAEHDIEKLREGLVDLDQGDAALWGVQPNSWIDEIQQRVDRNADFLRLLPVAEVCSSDLGPQGDGLVRQVPDGHRVASRNSSKVQSTLRQFVRDWAVEGEAERAVSYGPLISALLKHLPPRRGAPAPSVLCPGCGLGRLPFDLARYGYMAQGNEFSYHMLLGSHLILNRCVQADCFTIYPFILSTTNRRGRHDHLRGVRVPDLCPRMALPAHAQLSMAAGEFIEIFQDQVASWDAVATCFFLDTAKNVFLYVRTIAQLIREGGVWTNIGPLLYHYADVEHEISIELSWEEVRPSIARYFDLVEESRCVAEYASNLGSLTAVKYRCVHFVAIRNSEPTSGVSHPVF